MIDRKLAKVLYRFGVWGWLMTLVAFIFVARHAGHSAWFWTFPLWGPPAAYVAFVLATWALALAIIVLAVLLRPWLR